MSFNVGENVGPYRIIEQLGQGGMATVFKAYHASLDRYIAIKVLHPAFGEDPAFEARFQREARVVAKLEHPNIVPIYDYAEHEKRPYLVMKFIEGSTLKAKLDQGPLASNEILGIVDAVGSALAYAHKRNVLHRDIKPSNVLVAEDGQIYLADFGLARIAQLGESTLSGDMIIGTPQYISPEQAMGVKDLDERTDLYSFGVMLYELVVGKVPFNADTPFAIIHDHIYSPLPLPRKVNPSVPEQVERVLLKALAKDRLDRYENVNQMVSAFKEIWNQAVIPTQLPLATDTASPIVAPAQVDAPAQPTRAAVSPVKKRFPWAWIGAGFIILFLLGLTVYATQNDLFASFFSAASDLTSVPTTALQPTFPPPPPTEMVFPSPPPPDENKIPREVLALQKRANENPTDLNLQLELAIAYWNANLPGATYAVLGKLIRLAGPDDPAFYTEAGNQFAQQQGWPPAALLYFQAVKYHEEHGDAPPELVIPFHEAMYKSANHPDVPTVVPFDNIAQVDEPITLIARSRNAFFTKQFDKAYLLLEQVKKIDPNIPEVILLEAEFNALEGRSEQARHFATLLMTDPAVPTWIRIHAEEIMKRLP